VQSEGNTPQNREPTVGLLLYGNAPAHQSVLVTDVLAKNNVTTLEHPPYSPDLTPMVFLPVPLIESTIKG
jgi:transposase